MTTKWMGLVLVIGLVIAMGSGRVAAQASRAQASEESEARADDTPFVEPPPVATSRATPPPATPPPATPSPTTPPDVVELVGGGAVRGTIVENIPGLRVSIQLVTGEVRTFSGPEVQRVLLGGVAPAPTPATTTAAAPRAGTRERTAPRTERRRESAPSFDSGGHYTIRVAGRPGVVLHEVGASTGEIPVRGGTTRVDAFRMLCEAPCTLELSRGAHTFGISYRDGPIDRAGYVNLTRPVTLNVEYEDRSVIRTLGWVSFFTGVVLGTTLLTLGITDENGGLMVAGGVALVLFPVGAGMIQLNDHRAVRETAVRF